MNSYFDEISRSDPYREADDIFSQTAFSKDALFKEITMSESGSGEPWFAGTRRKFVAVVAACSLAVGGVVAYSALSPTSAAAAVKQAAERAAAVDSGVVTITEKSTFDFGIAEQLAKNPLMGTKFVERFDGDRREISTLVEMDESPVDETFMVRSIGDTSYELGPDGLWYRSADQSVMFPFGDQSAGLKYKDLNPESLVDLMASGNDFVEVKSTSESSVYKATITADQVVEASSLPDYVTEQFKSREDLVGELKIPIDAVNQLPEIVYSDVALEVVVTDGLISRLALGFSTSMSSPSGMGEGLLNDAVDDSMVTSTDVVIEYTELGEPQEIEEPTGDQLSDLPSLLMFVPESERPVPADVVEAAELLESATFDAEVYSEEFIDAENQCRGISYDTDFNLVQAPKISGAEVVECMAAKGFTGEFIEAAIKLNDYYIQLNAAEFGGLGEYDPAEIERLERLVDTVEGYFTGSSEAAPECAEINDRLSDAWGIEADDITELVECLRGVGEDDVADAAQKLGDSTVKFMNLNGDNSVAEQ